MSTRATFATTRRVLEQLRRDHRTLALVLVVPPALLVLLRYVLDGTPGAFQRVAVPLVGLFPLIVMFLVTSIAMLRERTGGTLERLMSLPLSKLDLLAATGWRSRCSQRPRPRSRRWSRSACSASTRPARSSWSSRSPSRTRCSESGSASS